MPSPRRSAPTASRLWCRPRRRPKPSCTRSTRPRNDGRGHASGAGADPGDIGTGSLWSPGARHGHGRQKSRGFAHNPVQVRRAGRLCAISKNPGYDSPDKKTHQGGSNEAGGMTEPAIVRSVDDVLRLVNERAELLGLRREDIDYLAGLASGHAGKLLSVPPQKRPAPATVFLLAGAVGYGVALVEDASALRAAKKEARN